MKKIHLKRKNQSRLRKRLITWGLVLSLAGIILAGVGHLSLIEQGYYPLESTVSQLSYENIGEGGYSSNHNQNKTFSVDEKANQLIKNGVIWEFSGRSVTYLGRLYLPKDLLEEIFVANLSTSWGRIVARSKKFSPHQWTESFPNLIAHAGGTFRGSAFNTFYTNSPEAILQNYQLGHRVFEIDFELTSDGKLAAVHDWDQFGYQNGQALSSQEWQTFQTYGSPQTEARFRTLLIGDLLDLMMEHEDIFIVTDTKITEASDAMRQQFEEIYREAMKRDESLLHRIIPQLYNEEMYDLIKDIYAFPSFIYTLYTSQDSPEKILNFVRSHEDVRVVTMPIGHGSYFTETFFEQLHADGKKVYTHTIHTYDELTRYKALGVDGFYTGLLLPRDVMTYQVTQ